MGWPHDLRRSQRQVTPWAPENPTPYRAGATSPSKAASVSESTQTGWAIERLMSALKSLKCEGDCSQKPSETISTVPKLYRVHLRYHKPSPIVFAIRLPNPESWAKIQAIAGAHRAWKREELDPASMGWYFWGIWCVHVMRYIYIFYIYMLIYAYTSQKCFFIVLGLSGNGVVVLFVSFCGRENDQKLRWTWYLENGGPHGVTFVFPSGSIKKSHLAMAIPLSDTWQPAAHDSRSWKEWVVVDGLHRLSFHLWRFFEKKTEATRISF